MAANTHNVNIRKMDDGKVDAKCQCGWTAIKQPSIEEAKSQWFQHVAKRKGKPGTITTIG